MENSVVRLALVGTGRAARARAREIALCQEARLSVVASADVSRALALAAEYGVEGTRDWSASLDRPDIDAVIVSTYNQLHFPVVRAALLAGKHVCVEYPLALSQGEGEHLLSLAANAGRVLHVEHIDLLSPWFQTVLHHLPELGDLRSLVWQDISARQPQPRDWTFDRQSGFSLFAGASVLSRIIRIAGPVVSVHATESLDGLQPDGRFQRRLTSAHLQFNRHVTGLIWDGTGFAAPGPSSVLTIAGANGILHAEDRKRVWLTTAGEDCRELPMHAGTAGLFAQDLASFCGQILRGESSYVPVGHVAAVLAAAGKARCSVLAQQ